MVENQILKYERNSLTLKKAVILVDFFFSLKRVEKTSEFAVSKAFSAGNSDLSRRLWNQIVDLETPEQIEDHDEVYAEGKRIHFLLRC